MSDRLKRIDAFYDKNPDKFCCDNCVIELSEAEYKESSKLTGLRMCGECLTKELKRCEECGSTNIELSKYHKKNVCFNCFIKLEKGGTKMAELGNFAKRNSMFISLDDGESIEAVYKGFKIAVNPYDDTKEIVNYKLETEFGIKTFRSGACALARLFEKIQPDTKIKVTRHGTGNKTSYDIEHQVDGKWTAVGKGEEEE